MKPTPSTEVGAANPMTVPTSVRHLRVLGKGRAAQAVLVEATMPEGRKQICVEKVFSAGWLTRTIYRLSFQAPFAYQSNRDAILASFYRRRVAAAIVAASDTGVKVATPLYVRFDEATGSWVLAAQWINGRGIKPAPADRSRWRRSLSAPRFTKHAGESPKKKTEVEDLVDTMHQLETLFNDSGLTGSGWQVAPRALVSTANLLRDKDHYTVIDLESGIPAVLVPKYLIAGAVRGELPPFDDLEIDKLCKWIIRNDRLLHGRLGADGLLQLRDDFEKLIEHSSRWKDSELSLLRRPWRLLRRDGMTNYQHECLRRWEQDRTIDRATATALPKQGWKARLIWYAGLFPGAMGRHASRLIGNRDYRSHLSRCIVSRAYRSEQMDRMIRNQEVKWIESQRLGPSTRLTAFSYLGHRILGMCTPRAIHRLMTDRRLRRKRARQAMLLMFSSRYQSWFGQSRIESSITSWQRAQRISAQQADQLRLQLSGNEVRAYMRGLGAHLALKTFAPVVVPAKYGGIAAFIASGNLWFLLPMLLMPVLRSLVTLASWWSTRRQRIPHGEALLAGMLPVVGSVAFPLQMFTTRSELSMFLIRDAASKLGRRLPIYGGPNSRTEIAMIRSTDGLIELLDILSTLTRKLPGSVGRLNQHGEALMLKSPHSKRTRLGSWLDQLATQQIAEHESQPGIRLCDDSLELTSGRLEAA